MRKDITGQRCGKLLAIRPVGKDKHSNILWECRCDCGNTSIVRTSDFIQQKQTQCYECCRATIGKKKRLDLSGKRFGKLTAIKYVKSTDEGQAIWECQCDCGNIVYASAARLQFGNLLSCGCLKSRGERKISEILTELDIPYSYQHKFPDCKSPFSNLPLYFDFYLPDYDCCIEYDGEQHFHPIDHFGGAEQFEKTKLRDKVKTDYCDNRQIKLIRIPYLDYNILDKKYLLSRLISEEGV